MKILKSLQEVKQSPPYPVVTIGNFDGVHQGHREIFRHIRERALKMGGTSIIFTFQDHPVKILRPERAPALISTPDQKVELISGLGIDWLIMVPFTEERASQPPEAFIGDLKHALSPKEIMVSTNFYFGARARGNITLLEKLGK